MSKQKKGSVQRRKGLVPLPTATNEPEVYPDVTVRPEASMEATVARWMGPGSTNAPSLSQEEYEEATYARDGVQLLERFLRGRMVLRPRSVFLVLTVCWFGIISWLFLRDNELGRFIGPSGMRWFWTKAGIYSVFYLIAGCIIGLSSLFSGRTKRQKHP